MLRADTGYRNGVNELMDYCHCDESAEQSVIFALVNMSGHAGNVFSSLREDDFLTPDCLRRYKKIHAAYKSGQLQEYANQVRQHVDIPSEIMPLWDAVKIVQNHSIRRKVECALDEVTKKCRDYSNAVSDVQEDIKRALLDAIDERACKSPSKTSEDLEDMIDGMQNSTTAFFTGIKSVDDMAPIQHGDFVILAARPGVGKSALSTGMIIENFLGDSRRKGLYFCIEMDNRQNYARISSRMSGVPLSKYINSRKNPPTAAEMSRISESVDDINGEFPKRWFIQGAISTQEICDITEIYKPDFVIIDYVQIIKEKGEGHERLSKISVKLRNLALDQKVAVIGIAQLNRDANGAVPSMSQIKGSGQFEQDATHIFLLDRPESERMNSVAKRSYYDQQGNEISIHNPQNPTNKAALIVAKNRNGPQLYAVLDFNTQTTSFTEYDR